MAFTLTHLSMGYRVAEKLQLDAGFVYLMHSLGGSKKVTHQSSRVRLG